MVAVERQILLRVARAEGVGGRSLLDCIFDHVRLDAHNFLLVINFRADRFPNFQGAFGREPHADFFDNLQSRIVNFPDFVLRQHHREFS